MINHVYVYTFWISDAVNRSYSLTFKSKISVAGQLCRDKYFTVHRGCFFRMFCPCLVTPLLRPIIILHLPDLLYCPALPVAFDIALHVFLPIACPPFIFPQSGVTLATALSIALPIPTYLFLFFPISCACYTFP